MKLTPKQQKFCEEYLIDLNATQAAIRAGYSENAARQIASDTLSKTYIQDYLSQRRAELKENTQLSPEWVLERLKSISDRCMTAEPVFISDGEGGKMASGEFTFDSSGANKATELIGKHFGMFKDKVEHSGNVSINWNEQKTYENKGDS